MSGIEMYGITRGTAMSICLVLAAPVVILICACIHGNKKSGSDSALYKIMYRGDQSLLYRYSVIDRRRSDMSDQQSARVVGFTGADDSELGMNGIGALYGSTQLKNSPYLDDTEDVTIYDNKQHESIGKLLTIPAMNKRPIVRSKSVERGLGELRVVQQSGGKVVLADSNPTVYEQHPGLGAKAMGGGVSPLKANDKGIKPITNVTKPPAPSQAEKDFNEAVSKLKRTIAEITSVNPSPQPSKNLNDDTTKVEEKGMYEEPSNVQELSTGFPITSKHNSVQNRRRVQNTTEHSNTANYATLTAVTETGEQTNRRRVQNPTEHSNTANYATLTAVTEPAEQTKRTNRRKVQNTTEHSNTANYATLTAVTEPGEQTKPSAYDAISHQDRSVKGVSSSQYYEPYTVVGSGYEYDINHPTYTTLPQDSAYTEMSSHPRKRRTKRRHHSKRHGRLRTHSKDYQNYPGLTGINESGMRSRRSSVSRTSNRRHSRIDDQSQQNTYDYPVLADITESRRRSQHRANNTRLSISNGIADRRASRQGSQSQSTTHPKRRKKSRHERGQSRQNSQSEYNRVTPDVRVSMSGREQQNTEQNYTALNEETDRGRQNIIAPQKYANNKVHPA